MKKFSQSAKKQFVNDLANAKQIEFIDVDYVIENMSLNLLKNKITDYQPSLEETKFLVQESLVSFYKIMFGEMEPENHEIADILLQQQVSVVYYMHCLMMDKYNGQVQEQEHNSNSS